MFKMTHYLIRVFMKITGKIFLHKNCQTIIFYILLHTKSSLYQAMKIQTVRFLLFISLSLICEKLGAQTKYSLSDVIDKARQNSPSSMQAVNRFENSYWRYRTFQANYLPQLTYFGTLPDFTRAINSVTQPDGTNAFREFSQITTGSRFELSQNIAQTGGQVFLSTNLNRLDVLSGGNKGETTYLSNPLQIGIRQSLFAFNRLKWDKKIEPVRYEETRRRYNEEMERIALQSTNLFFNLLSAQINYNFQIKNQANNDTIYRIAEGRFSVGKIAENELLQLRLNNMNSKQQVSQAKLGIEAGKLALQAFLGVRDYTEEIVLIEPGKIPPFLIDPPTAIAEARKNRQAYIGYERQRLEASREVSSAKGNTGVQVSVAGSFGLAQNANNLPAVYQNVQNQQTLNIGLEIPILTWGRQKAQIRTAIANQALVQSVVAQEEVNFEQEIYMKVKQFDVLRERLSIAIESDGVAQRRYEIAQNRYLIAKISITDLNIAMLDKDRAKQDYLNSLQSMWNAYYELRALTLYDFEEKRQIRYDLAIDFRK